MRHVHPEQEQAIQIITGDPTCATPREWIQGLARYVHPELERLHYADPCNEAFLIGTRWFVI